MPINAPPFMLLGMLELTYFLTVLIFLCHQVFIETEKKIAVFGRKHIEHTLGISNFMVGIELACKEVCNIHLIDKDEILARSPESTRWTKYPFRWKTRVRHNGECHDIAVVPDYIFGLALRRQTRKPENEKFFFVEIDRATMPVTRRDIRQTSYMRKIQSYADTYERGLAERRYGMKGFQVANRHHITKNAFKIFKPAMANMKDASFSASTFLFKEKDNGQAHFPFHQGWTNAKGKPTDMI